jgi:hypothetical protein
MGQRRNWKETVMTYLTAISQNFLARRRKITRKPGQKWSPAEMGTPNYKQIALTLYYT